MGYGSLEPLEIKPLIACDIVKVLHVGEKISPRKRSKTNLLSLKTSYEPLDVFAVQIHAFLAMFAANAEEIGNYVKVKNLTFLIGADIKAWGWSNPSGDINIEDLNILSRLHCSLNIKSTGIGRVPIYLR